MQPTPRPPNLETLHTAWQAFVQTGHLAEGVDPLVRASWQRCAPRLNPHNPPLWVSLSDDVLALATRRQHIVLSIAYPIMEDLLQTIEGEHVLMVLLDSTACVLSLVGDAAALEFARRLNVQRGVFLSEGRVGTLAGNVALAESCPAQVVGPEHYLSYWHDITSAAAPLSNLDGVSLGAVMALLPLGAHNPQAVGLVTAAARAIENQVYAERFVEEANLRATQLNVTLNALSEGVLAWSADGRLTQMNARAGDLLGLDPRHVVGGALSACLTLPETLTRAVALGQELTDAEVTLGVEGGRVEALASLRLVRNGAGEVTDYILTLRRVEQMRQLFHRMAGSQARLTLDDWVGQSAALRLVRRQALAAANARACVLIDGESGTGKNLLARAIHNSGRWAGGPFLSINCRAIPRELVLGEFLGFEAGAFNNGGQPSKFELAEGGTLFLEEVDALPLDMQAALLRVIEAGDVIRLGGTRVIPVNVRLMTSCHGALEDRVREGAFRADLLFRLSSFTIHLPPLRERPEDIPLLIDRRLDRLSAQLGRTCKLTAEARAALLAYPWPGNAREMESVLERAALQADGHPIDLPHLPALIREGRPLTVTAALAEPVRTLAEAEQAAIRTAWQATGGNVTRAARLLGVGRTTLWRKLKALGLLTAEACE